MIRKRVGAAVLHVYPPAVRGVRGAEMLGTLLDAGDVSSLSFARESASLGVAGLRERAREASQVPTGRLIVDGLRLAVVMWIVVWLAGVSADALAYPRGLQGLGGWLLLLWPILVCSLLGYDRLAGVYGIVWVVLVQMPIALGPYALLLASSVVPLAGFIAMAILPRRGPHQVRRLGWLIPIAVISLVSQPAMLGFGMWGIAALALASAGGLLVAAVNPRLALASAFVWASIGAMYAEEAASGSAAASPSVLLIASAPLTILAVSTYRHVIRPRID